MVRLCCPECFGDRGLRRNIIPTLTSIVGTCGYCRSDAVDLLEPTELFDYFELVASVYDPDPLGKTLVEWLKEDWHLFSKFDTAHAKELLGDIFDDGDIARKGFSPSPTYKSEGLARWATFRDELMSKNRYFLDEALDLERLEELLSHLYADDMPNQWFRARISTGDAIYGLNEMGAPPKQLATHGRANPTGIPYLYLGSMPETAIAELRPHTGELASVAHFNLIRAATAVDLRSPRLHVSPFILSDAREIGQMRADIPFLEKLGDELTRPVLPRSAAIDYLPSQYLCEFIKKRGYDGVLYRSSVSEGINLALFDPAGAVPSSVEAYNVTRVSVESARRP